MQQNEYARLHSNWYAGHNADNECLELFPAAQRQNHNQADEESNFYLEDKQTSQFEKHAHEVMSTVRKQLGRRESDPYCKKIEEDLLNLVKEKSDFSGAALTLTQLAKENFSKDDKPSDLIPAAWPSAKRPAVEALDSLAFDGYERNNKRHKPMDTLPSAIVGPRGRRPDHLEKMAKLEAQVAALRPQIHGLQNELEDAERDIVVTKHQNDQVWGAVHQVHVMIKLALEAEKTQGQGFIEADTQAHSLQAPNNIMPIPSPALAGFLSPFDNDLFDALSMFVSPELRRGEEVGNAEAKPAQRLQFTTTKVPQAGC